jgi:hypothetical protein
MGLAKKVVPEKSDDDHDAKHLDQGTSFMRRTQTFKRNKKQPVQDEMDTIHFPAEENESFKVSNRSDVCGLFLTSFSS